MEQEQVISLNREECIAKTPRRRQKTSTREETCSRKVLRDIQSVNYNGSYRIFKNSDKSYSCTCLSFLYQRGVRNGCGYSTCKHIREHLGDGQLKKLKKVTKPSIWHITALKRLGVQSSEHLTYAQAYFLFQDLLERQGIEYRESDGLFGEHLATSFLPMYSYGAEFEMLIKDRRDLETKLNERGFPAYETGYEHTMTNSWKIGHDSSIRVQSGYEPVEVVSPKLFGVQGFDAIRGVLAAVSEIGAKVNRSCGFHVHVDAWNWDTTLMLELAKIWVKIETPVLWYLVSPSRRGNDYCKPLTIEDLITLSENRLTDRYHSLNLCAFQRHKTVEFRLHNGTAEAQKVIPWVVFCLMLVHAVKKGVRSRDVEPTFNGVMDAIGMNDKAISVIRESRRYLYRRFMYWKKDAEANPSHMPEIQMADVRDFDLERELARRRRRVQRREIESRRDSVGYSYNSRRLSFATVNADLPANSVNNLASMRPSSVIQMTDLEGGYESGAWNVASRTAQHRYDVTFDVQTDCLTCNCRGFRTHAHCWHSINVARYIVMRRQRSEIDRELQQFDQEEVSGQCAG